MWKHILVQGCYQILVLFLVIFGGAKLIGDYAVRPSVLRRSNRPLTSCLGDGVSVARCCSALANGSTIGMCGVAPCMLRNNKKKLCEHASAHDLLHPQPESACTEYSRVRGLDASALQLSGAQSAFNLCCEVDAGGVCTSNLQPGGVYLPGEQSVPCRTFIYCCSSLWHHQV